MSQLVGSAAAVTVATVTGGQGQEYEDEKEEEEYTEYSDNSVEHSVLLVKTWSGRTRR